MFGLNKLKKGLFIYSNFDFSSHNAGVKRMKLYAQSLADNNTSIYLVTCSSSKLSEDSFKEIFPNIFVLQNNKITYSFHGTFKFIINLYKFSISKFDEKSFLFYPSPLVYLELIALLYLKLIKKCKVYYELNEVRKYSATFEDRISIRKPLYTIKKILYKTTFSFMQVFLMAYDGLICISTAIEDYGKKFNSSTIRIPILTDPYNKINPSKNIYFKENSFNLGFSGSIQPHKENLINFLSVLGKLKENQIDFTFNLCGYIKPDHHDLLNQMADKLAIKDQIIYYGNLNNKELSTFLSQQQLLVIPRGFTLQNKYGFSTKLSDYLDHGKPILITKVSDNNLFIIDGENGFIVEPDNNDMMYNKLLYIINNIKLFEQKIKITTIDTSLRYFYFKNYKVILTNFLFKHVK